MPVPSTVDSADAAATLGQQLYEFDAATRNRGSNYHRTGRVLKLARQNDETVRASVAGSELYEVTLQREGSRWNGVCTCPMEENCKHVFATMLAWMAHLVDATGGGATTRLAASPRATFRQQWEPILADKLGRPLAPEEGAFLGKISQIFHNFRQSGRVSSVDLTRLGFMTNESRRPAYEPAYAGWWTTAPSDPLELWQYIAHDIESSDLTVPEFMRPLTDTAPVRARLSDRLRREAIARWNERFQRLALKAQAPIARAEIEATPEAVDLRLVIGANQWVLETRSRAEAPWKPATRGFVDRFVRGESAQLGQLDCSPAVFAFLALCQEQFRRTYYFNLTTGGPGSAELLRRLLLHRLARTLIVDAAGQPLTFADAPITWRLARAQDDQRDYELALHLPDGTPLPPGALHLPGRPDYYLHRNVVYRGPPALDGATAAAAVVPAEAIEQPEVLQMLRGLGTQLPVEIEARFVNVSMRARIECALDVDFSENEILTLHLSAIADESGTERAWTSHGWQETAPPPSRAKAAKSEAAATDGKIYSFDLIPATRVAGQLGALKLSYDEYHKRWTRRITRTFPDEFIAWRAALPPEVEVLAAGELASLLGGPVRASINFELIETAAHRDWFDLALALKPEDSTLTPDEIALLLKARGKLVRLPGKGWRRLSVEMDGASAAALESAGFDTASIAESALAGEKHRFHALQLAQTAVANFLPEQQAGALRARARSLASPTPPALPKGLRAELRPYQVEGFHFLAFLSANRLGGVLADDMGLGKTLQALAWLLWLAEQQPKQSPLRALVVCPKSVVGNWEAETARFAPALATVRFTPKVAEATAKERPAGDPHRIVLANYTQLRLSAEYFHAQQWDAVILDEGQFIKTPTSKVAQVARDLPGAQRLILTGTPIENRLLDLWSLFAFSLPGLLGSQASFKRHYAQDNPLALARLRTRVRHFLLRRTKSQVASDLPARTEEDIVIDLEGEQAKLYQAELKRARAQLLKIDSPRQLDKARFNILASLMRLRQICCHPALVDPVHRDVPSAKLDELMERVEELRDEGHQVLVFSQFVQMLEIIQERLAAAGIGHLILTGATENRDELVKEFQGNKQHTVFLLSLKAAGFGLNLTAASYVILYDPWWNPAVEAQAIDRTHRIGQTVPVNAYRLIARGTVEEKIRALQRDKAALAGAIVQEESLAQVLDLESLQKILG